MRFFTFVSVFTGIIESMGIVHKIEPSKSNLLLWFTSDFHSEISIDQSIAHNGICLTVDALESKYYRVTAIQETILRTNIQHWSVGDSINLERCLLPTKRIDGHIVQGHIDTVGKVIHIKNVNGSNEYTIEYPSEYSELIIEKGSVALNGISLTCYSIEQNRFSVSIIPYTMEYTNAHLWRIGTEVNIEFDILGKYIQRRNQLIS